MKNNISCFRIIRLIVCGILLAGLFFSCKTIEKTEVDYKDLSYLYNPTKNPINPQFSILNQTDETSLLSIRLSSTELFFSEANPKGVPTAELMIKARLYNFSKGKILTDTAALSLSIVKEKGRQEYIYSMPLKVEKGSEYMVDIKTIDRLRLLITQDFMQFNTLNYTNRYNFKVVSHFDKNEVFSPVLRIDQYINLLYPRTHIDSLFISYYKPLKAVPDPPSMLLPEKIIDYDPKQVVAFPYSDTLPMMFPKEGVYLCSIDRNIKDGFTFLNFGSSYPRMFSPEVMIDPLAYLANQDEMAGMKSASKPKAALDDFWIKCGGNVEKSRELIRIYYTRVQYSNFYFTSYKEGWRTERGMIYIIYGPPDKVYKTSEGESWGYRKATVKSKWGSRYDVTDTFVFFNFKKRESVFSDNDFYLSRSESVLTYWDKAIASWRKGIVFRLDNPRNI